MVAPRRDSHNPLTYIQTSTHLPPLRRDPDPEMDGCMDECIALAHRHCALCQEPIPTEGYHHLEATDDAVASFLESHVRYNYARALIARVGLQRVIGAIHGLEDEYRAGRSVRNDAGLLYYLATGYTKMRGRGAMRRSR